VLTDADYRLAESRLSYKTNLLVAHTVVKPEFLPGNRVWYRDASPAGDGAHMRATYVIVDPATKTVSPAFDHAALAPAIAAVMPGKPAPDANDLHLDDLKLLDLDASGHPRALTFTVDGQRLRCAVATKASCALDTAIATGPDADPPSVMSPDGALAAFIRNWNLWMRDVKTGAETQLTKDGVPDFGYATDNAGWTHSDKAILVWSPDSKKIATFQQDQRKTGLMYLVPVTNTHPVLEAWRYPLVGDKDVTMIERVVIDVPTGKVVRFKMPPDQHRSTICDDVSCSGGWDDVEWAPDAKTVAFVSTSREHKDEWLRVADAKTGDVRSVFHESAPKFFESGDNKVNWHYLPESNEFLWFSERSGWGQMYLYDLTTGALKDQITTGDGNVTQVLSVDRKARRLVYLAVGKQVGEDPYYRTLYASDFAGGAATRLTPAEADHAVTISGDGAMFVDIASTPVTPQVTTLRDMRTGTEVMPVAQQDISALVATGWKPETPFTVLARDGKTTLYGYMTRPTNFNAAKKYPLTNSCGNSLAGHAACSIVVSFVPHAVGPVSATLTVADEFRTQSIALSGTGIAPAGVSLLPAGTLNFPATGVAQGSAPQPLTLTNNGGLTLILSSVTLTGDFSLATGSTCGASLAPAQACTLAVVFTPAATGARTGSVAVVSNAANSPQTVALTGVGVDFTFAIDGASTAQTVASGTSATFPLLLTSPAGLTGNAALTCAGVPTYAVCNLSTATAPLGGSTVITATIATGTTTALLLQGPHAATPDGAGRAGATSIGVVTATLLPLGLLLLRRRRLHLPRLLGLLLVLAGSLPLLVGATALTGCGTTPRTIPGDGSGSGSGGSAITPAGTYAVVVTASSAGMTRSVTLSVTVQ